MSSHYAKHTIKTDQKPSTMESVHGSKSMDQITDTSKPSNDGSRKTTAISCEVRGNLYPSLKAAAEELGISPSAITSMLDRQGTLETAGLGRTGPVGKANAARSISLWGVTFASRTEAARELGMERSCFSKRISKSATKGQKEALMLSVMTYLKKHGK
jgi:hypothetical protein